MVHYNQVLLKKHNRPKKYSQRYENKIVTSKKYDEHGNVTRSSIKNKLFEISKEFKEFKFQQNSQIKIYKKL